MRFKTLPHSFEDFVMRHEKRMMRCTQKNQLGAQCECFFRFSSTGHPHSCKFPAPTIEDLDSPEAEAFIYLGQPLENKLMHEISSVFVDYNIPFSGISSVSFHKLLEAIVPLTTTDLKKMDDKKIFTSSNLTNYMTTSSQYIEQKFYQCASRVGIVHLAIDEGTVHHRHFLDVLVLTPYNEIKPFPGFTLEQSSFSSDDIGNFVHSCILDVQSKNCTVVSIIADNLNIHTLTFAHWKQPFYISNLFPDCTSLLYSPCFCHTFQLILLTVSKVNSNFQILDELLITISTFLRRPGIRNLIGSCPTFAQTRWLSRMETILWILKRDSKITRINIDELKQKDKRLFENYISRDNFNKLQTFSKIISPFDIITRFFEQDSSTISQAITVIKIFYEQLKKLQIGSEPEIFAIIQDMVAILFSRIKQHYDINLLKASYLLTMEGRFSIKFPQQPTPFKDAATFLYNPPVLHIHDRPLYESFLGHQGNKVTDNDDINEDDDEIERNLNDIDDTELVTIDSLEDNINILFQTETPLIFLETFMIEQCDKHNILPDNVLPILEYFYFDPAIDERFGRKLENFSPEKNLILWQWVGINFPAWKEITDLIIGIVSIPTSESSVERNFSKRKRIQTHLQSVTSSALLLAKMRIQYEIKKS
jgi:hypothetical protein